MAGPRIVEGNILAQLAEKTELNQRCANLVLRGHILTADSSGVLWWADERCLIVSDLHLEKGSSFARRGMMVPPYDTGLTLDALAEAISHYKPRRVISLGDSFHDGEGAARMPMPYREKLLALIKNREWMWVSGNHDPDPPKDLPGLTCTELALGDLIFRHEPSPDYVRGEVAGHLHPAGKIRRRGKSVRRPCFICDTERLIMPAFGAFTGGLNVCDKAFKGLFDETKKSALLLGQDRLYAIKGQNLVF